MAWFVGWRGVQLRYMPGQHSVTGTPSHEPEQGGSCGSSLGLGVGREAGRTPATGGGGWKEAGRTPATLTTLPTLTTIGMATLPPPPTQHP